MVLHGLPLILLANPLPVSQAQSATGQHSLGSAIAGEPFGVLVFELSLPENWDGREPRVLIDEASGRVFYPAVSSVVSEILVPQERLLPQQIGRPGGLIDRLRNTVRPESTAQEVQTGVRIHALFRGDQPLNIRVYGDLNQQFLLPVSALPNLSHYQQLFDAWWSDMQKQTAEMLASQPSHASLPHFLTSMLARQLELTSHELPEPPASDSGWISLGDSKPQFLEMLESLSGSERFKEQAVRRILSQPLLTEEEPLPLPPEPFWQQAEVPLVDVEVNVEEIATRVPPECFYLRFGSFGNYMWFQELAQRFGGDLSHAVFMPGLNYGGMSRAEKMLATRITTVSKMFGDKLIKDMALIGNDLYFNDGASMAVLFQTTNPALLKASFDSDRRAAMAENPDAALSEIMIGDKNVSLLSTPDNRIRAFLLVDGSFVLIATSQRLMERFMAVGQGQPSLASTEMFPWVRSRMPVENEYSVFGYFPPEFFQALLGPHHQIESKRRLLASAHLEIAELASLTALTLDRWTKPSESDVLIPNALPSNASFSSIAGAELSNDLDAMRDAKLLPAWFDQRPDESRVLRSAPQWVDSLRGSRGSFLPIADVDILSVSPEEAAEYARTAEHYQKQWGRMDPLFFGLRRFQAEASVVPQEPREQSTAVGALDNSGQGPVEQFTIEAYLAPFEPKKYGWVFEQLAEPSPVAIQFPPDDMLSVQLRFQGPLPGESYYLFGGLKDMLPPQAEEVQGLLKSLRALKAAPAYLGAWPKPDLIQSLPLGIGSRLAQPDFAGYSRMLGGLWRWQNDQWSLLSFHKNILDTASGQMGVGQVSDAAQIRIALADFNGSKLAEWIDQMWWEQGWKSSHANTNLLDALQQQFKVPAQDCPRVAARLLGAQPQCALGGQYQFQEVDLQQTLSQPAERSTTIQQSGFWYSSAWHDGAISSAGKPLAPADYSAPWIQWLHGAQIQVTQQPQSLSLVGLINVDLPPVPGTGSTDSPSHGRPSSDLLPMGEFNVFELPLKLFGNKNGKDKDGEPKRGNSPAKRQSF